MNKLVFALFFLFLNISTHYESLLVKVFPIFLFGLIIIDERIRYGNKITHVLKNFKEIMLLCLFVVIGIFRNGRDNFLLINSTFKALNFIFFLIAYLLVIQRFRWKWSLIRLFLYSIVFPLFLYVIFNLFLFFAGIRHPEIDIGKGVILANFGININRVKFFFSNGINGYGTVLGILLTLSSIGFITGNRYKNFFLFFVFISLISLLLTDSRGPLVFSLLILFMCKIYFIKTKNLKGLWLVPFLGFVGPLLLISLLSFLATTEYGNYLSRSSDELMTGNSRVIIWGLAFNEFLTFNPVYHLIGYGEFGHYTAGLSPIWGKLFPGDIQNTKYMHPHNTFLSIAYDYGYLGLFLFIAFQLKILKLIKKYWQSNRVICMLILSNLLYFNFVGIGETVFGFYYQNVIHLFILINIFPFLLSHNSKMVNYES